MSVREVRLIFNTGNIDFDYLLHDVLQIFLIVLLILLDELNLNDFNQQYNNCSHSVKRTEILFALKLGFMLEKSRPPGGTHLENGYGDVRPLRPPFHALSGVP